MECVLGALKSSFRPEMEVKLTQSPCFDDLWTDNGYSSISEEDFFVDDLFDFSNAFAEEEEEEREKENGYRNVPVPVSVLLQKEERKDENNSTPRTNTSYGNGDFGSFPGSEITVPAEELWLSYFVEDSFSGYSLTYPAGNFSAKILEDLSELEVTSQGNQCLTTKAQTKARRKRARTGVRVCPPSLTESTTTSCSSSSSTASFPLLYPWLGYGIPGQSQTAESFFEKSPAKKQKKQKTATQTSGGWQQPRRCSHCGVQKTPQWRAGPAGHKTLCNACGVRYKSGRLLPEYRPACSPTFSSGLYSNNHRKVLEIRRKEVDAGPVPPVQSF